MTPIGHGPLTSAALVLASLAAGAAAQPLPPSNRAAVERGQQAFGIHCAFCHGADARGGAQGGSDLLRSPVVLEDEGGSTLGEFLKVGRPEKKMPRFDLEPQQVADIAAFLASRLADASGGARKVSIVVGDAKAGEAFFNGAGRCVTCHSVTGDLKAIGAKYEPVMLQGRMVVPRGRGGYPGYEEQGADKPLRARVTPSSGTPVSGDVLYLSDFYITIKDASGKRHTFARRGDTPKVEITDPLQAHIDLLRTLTDKNIHDLTAYLVTLK